MTESPNSCPRGCVDTDGCGCEWNAPREGAASPFSLLRHYVKALSVSVGLLAVAGCIFFVTLIAPLLFLGIPNGGYVIGGEMFVGFVLLVAQAME